MSASETDLLVRTPQEEAYETAAAEAAASTGTFIGIGVMAFTFATLAFTYFYLRSQNSSGLWRPHHITGPEGLGGSVMALSVLGAASALWSARREAGRNLALGLTALAALAGAALQVYALTVARFYPGSSGYASVFVGWAALNTALLLVAFWFTETTLARAWRSVAGRVGNDGTSPDEHVPTGSTERVVRRSLAWLWGAVVVIELVFWGLMYL